MNTLPTMMPMFFFAAKKHLERFEEEKRQGVNPNQADKKMTVHIKVRVLIKLFLP